MHLLSVNNYSLNLIVAIVLTRKQEWMPQLNSDNNYLLRADALERFSSSIYIRWKQNLCVANQKAPFLNIYSCKTILLPIFSLYSPDKSEYGLLFCLPQINNSGIQFWFWLFPRAKVHKAIIYSFFMEIFKLCQQKMAQV